MTTTEDPELEDVRGWYIDGRRVHNPFASNANLVQPFNRWLDAHDAKVQADTAHSLRVAVQGAFEWPDPEITMGILDKLEQAER